MVSDNLAMQTARHDGKGDANKKDRVLAALRAKIGAIEKTAGPGTGKPAADHHSGRPALSLTPDLDSFLPHGGLLRGALHEVVGPPGAQGAAAGFAAALMSLAAARQGVVLWCRRHFDGQENGELYGPGLSPFGLGPERLLEVRAGRDQDILWALEEGLQSSALCAVLGEVSDLSFTASRRLQLAAEAQGIPALVLRHNSQSHAVSAAHTRWGVEPARNGTPAYNIKWKLNLLRCRGATADSQATTWQVEWRDGHLHDDKPRGKSANRTAAGGFAVAATSGLRPGYPAEPGLAV